MTATPGAPARALFGAGCFWGVELKFRRVPGVLDVQVGYAGGTVPDPTYEQVCTGTTGHAEVVEVLFDPAQVSYETLLRVFLEIHDPTQYHRQGPDVGPQYRSVIFALDETQAGAARAALAADGRPVATEVAGPAVFYPAEDDHQRYLERRGYR